MLAGDGTPVIIHDETVDRTTDGRGEVSKMNYSERFLLNTQNKEKIPKYEDAVRLCRELGLWAQRRDQTGKGPRTRHGRRGGAPNERIMEGRVDRAAVVVVFARCAGSERRKRRPNCPRGGLCDQLPDDWRSILKRLGCRAVHCNYKSLNGKLAADIHEAGYAILLWTVNDPAEARRLLAIRRRLSGHRCARPHRPRLPVATRTWRRRPRCRRR